MTVEEIGKIVQEDMKYNETNVLKKQFDLPSKKQFWLSQLFAAKRELESLKRKKAELTQQAAESYNKDSAVGMSTKSVEATLKARSESFKKLGEEIDEAQFKVEYLTEVTKIYSNATYDIKNIVEMQKMNNI